MAPGRTLNAANLERLGAPLLAELLIEISRGNGPAQRRLRLALAGGAGAAEAIRTVAKRLTSIAGSRTWLNGQRIRPLVAELDAQRRAIGELIAPSDPREAFELLWRLAGCAKPVFARSDDPGGLLRAAFAAAVRDLGPLAQRAALPPGDLSDRAFRALTTGGEGAWDELIPVLAPQLGPSGLQGLGTALRDWQAEPAVRPGPSRPVAAPFFHPGRDAAVFLQQVADALGDVDGFIAQFDDRARATPAVAAAIARRLLDAGRAPEAWAALERTAPAQREQAPPEWDEARVDALAALGRADEVPAFRWDRFLRTLDPAHLRAHLRTLPDFDYVEAEQRALDHALGFADVHRALGFLLAWPDLHRANRLVLARTRALNGDRYELLSPAADALDARHPLAAILLRRAMIDFTLGNNRSSRFRHAVRHLLDCRTAAVRVLDFAGIPDQPSYERGLRAAHGRRTVFWQDVTAST